MIVKKLHGSVMNLKGHLSKYIFCFTNYFLGGLGSYTPSKIQGLDNAFQLGVTRTPTRNTSNGNGTSNGSEVESNGEKTSDVIITSSSESLWPAKDAVSWSGTTSAFTDMLF